MQEVRFGGHIENTSFGNDFLESDIILKKYSLNLEKQVQNVNSYSKLLLDHELNELSKKGIDTISVIWVIPDSLNRFKGESIESGKNSQSRFWFNYKDPFSVRIRGNVFCIMSLDIIIQSEISINGVVQQNNIQVTENDSSDIKFSDLFSKNYYKLCETHPVLKRLKLLFDMTAIAEGLKNTKDLPDISYLLNKYPVKKIITKKEYELIKKCAVIQRSDGKTSLLEMSGGIKTSVNIEWLNRGDVSLLEKCVLDSRPDTNSLFWQLPLEKWEMPNSKGITNTNTAKTPEEKSGCSVYTNTVVITNTSNILSDNKYDGFTPIQNTALPINTKGVQMKMIIDSSNFVYDTALNTVQKQILDSIKKGEVYKKITIKK